MMKTLRFLSIACAMCWAASLWAATEVDYFCGFELNSGGSKPLMTWETNHQGDVIITLKDGEGSTNTRFRANGMSDGLNVFYIVNEQKGNQLEAKNYFTADLKVNQFILRRRQDVAWPDGGYYIKFYDKYVQWLCDENNNAAQQVNCFFPYGDICGTLAQPVVTDLQADGTITFGAVQGATSYVARVYFDGEMLHEQSIVSGEKMYFHAYATGTHEVTVQAVSDNNYSKESVGTAWELTGDIGNLPKSKFCGEDYMISKPNEIKANAYVTIETHKADGIEETDTVVFTISDATGSEEPKAYWRSNGLNQNGLLYDGNKFTDYFQLVENPHQKTMIQYVPKEGATVEFGKKITYNIGVNPQSAEWATSLDDNAAANTMSFSYIYGTTCAEPTTKLDTPTNLAVTDAGVVTFTAVENAGKYVIKVVDGDDEELFTQVITNGGTIDRGEAIVLGFSYFVSIQAQPAEEGILKYRESDWSSAVEWTPKDTPSSLEPIHQFTDSPIKLIKNGHLYIIRNGKQYNAVGF